VALQMVPGEGSRLHWRAGGLLAQFLPEAPDRMRLPDLHGGDGDDGDGGTEVDDAWNEVQILLGTVEDDELLDPTVGSERLLYRLFHEHGVRVFEGASVTDDCSCSRERIRSILDGFSPDEIAESIEDGEIKVSCEFCSSEYRFDPSEFKGSVQ
jgi:molecular chaperone Hsp33